MKFIRCTQLALIADVIRANIKTYQRSCTAAGLRLRTKRQRESGFFKTGSCVCLRSSALANILQIKREKGRKKNQKGTIVRV